MIFRKLDFHADTHYLRRELNLIPHATRATQLNFHGRRELPYIARLTTLLSKGSVPSNVCVEPPRADGQSAPQT